jgi:hypothetical protein
MKISEISITHWEETKTEIDAKEIFLVFAIEFM